MKVKVPPVTARNLMSALSLIVVVAFIAAFMTPPPRPQGPAKVTRLLKRAERPAHRHLPKAAGNDSPTAGAARARGRHKSIFVTPKRGRRSRVGKLEIPKIRLKTSFYEGVHDSVVKLGPGHWPGTPFPGKAGNAVFAGHRTTHSKPFADLDLLRRGDAIKTAIGKNKRLTYRVSNVYVVPEARYVRSVLRQPSNNRARRITLFACTPKGFRTHRIVVRAVADRLPRKEQRLAGGKEATR